MNKESNCETQTKHACVALVVNAHCSAAASLPGGFRALRIAVREVLDRTAAMSHPLAPV